MFGIKRVLHAINKKIDKISLNMERFKLVDYVHYLENPRKMLLSNFLSGVARGFGMAVGFTLLGAILIYVLQIVVRWQLPVIGKIISDIAEIIQESLRDGRR